MGNFNGLFNIWTVLGTIVFAIVTIFFILSHPILGLIATWIGITLYFVALHYELKERYKDRFRYVSTIGSILCGIILAALSTQIDRQPAYPPAISPDTNAKSKMPEASADSFRVAKETKGETGSPKPKSSDVNESTDNRNVINAPNSVISLNQQGGITAGTVNIHGLPKREIDIDALSYTLRQFSGDTIIVDWYNDPEVQHLVNQISTAINQSGCVFRRGRVVAYASDIENFIGIRVFSDTSWQQMNDRRAYLAEGIHKYFIDYSLDSKLYQMIQKERPENPHTIKVRIGLRPQP